ncbi:MAG: hypothetical protein WCT04_11865 [Planctomycetota bacterium]
MRIQFWRELRLGGKNITGHHDAERVVVMGIAVVMVIAVVIVACIV